MISDDELKQAADALATAEAECRPIDPLSERFTTLDAQDAYYIQLHNIARRCRDGATVKGHKVGLSSRAMQKMMNVDEPDYGHLLDDMFVFEGSDVAVGQLCAPRVEIEVAFVLQRTLSGPGVTAADVIRCTDFVLPSIEIIDSRIADWRITLTDTVADNASSAKVVLGGRPTRLSDVDPRRIGAVLEKNGEVMATGASGAVLGNPVTAVAWLANKVAQFGVTLEAGHVILPGSCTAAIGVGAGDTITASFAHLGDVTVRFSPEGSAA